MNGYNGDRSDIAFTLCLFGAIAVYVVLAYDYPPAVRQVPLFAAWLTLAFLVLDVVARTPTEIGRSVSNAFRAAGGETTSLPKRPPFRREIDFVLWMLALVLGIVLVGFLIALPVFAFTYLMARGGQSAREALLGAVGLTAFSWVLFELLMRYELYRGVLLGGDL